MVVGKILIDLRQFLPRGMYLLNRHIPQISKSWYIFKRIKFKLKVSLQETPSTIPTNFNLYKRCYLKRHFPQFHNSTNSNMY